MRFIYSLLFLLSSLCSFGQVLINSYQYAEQLVPLTLDTSPTTMSKTVHGIGDRMNSSDESAGALYINGKTYFTVGRPWNLLHRSYGVCHVYDDDFGYYPAFIDATERMGALDRHMQPVMFKYQDQLHFAQEWDHDDDLYILRANNYNLDEITRVTLYSNTGYARLNWYNYGSEVVLLFQSTSGQNIAIRRSQGAITSLTAHLNIFQGSATARAYPNIPYGSTGPDANGWYRLVVTQNDETAGNTDIRNKFLLKTQDFLTFTNEQETHSFTSTFITSANAIANGYVYKSGSVEQYKPCTVVHHDSGKFFDFTWDGLESIVTTYWNGSAWASRTFDTNLDIQLPNNADDNVQSPFKWAHAQSETTFYLVVDINDGTYIKPHLFKTTNAGESWTHIGDMFPGINKTMYRFNGPRNSDEIPENSNFSFWANENTFDNNTANTAEIYAVKAAFGELQAETGTRNTDGLTNLTDIAGWRAVWETDNVSTSGGIITTVNDKSGNARHLTAVGSPVVTGNAIELNGTDQKFTFAHAGFVSDSKFTLAAVVRNNSSGTFCPIISFGRSGAALATNHLAYVSIDDLSTDKSVAVELSRSATIRYHLGAQGNKVGSYSVVVVTGDGYHIRMWVNGVEVAKNYKDDSGNSYTLQYLGNWLTFINAVAAINYGQVGGYIDSETAVFKPLHFKAIAYHNTVLSKANRQKVENFLATKYSITLDGSGN